MLPTIFNLLKLCKKSNNTFTKCPYCHSKHIWRHGTYSRKGFHDRTVSGSPLIRIVQRFICQFPSCRHSFSVLPGTVLPFCRFFLSDALTIFLTLTKGSSAYSVARHQWGGVALSVVLRFKNLFKKVSDWLSLLLQEVSTCKTDDLASVIKELLKYYSWNQLRAMWCRRIYPLRYCK